MSNNQKGFGLVSVIMAATLMSVVSLGFTNMLLNNSRSMAYLEDKSAALDLKNNLTLQLGDAVSCKNTMGSINFTLNALGVLSIKDKNNSVLFKKDSVYDHLQIGDIRIENNGTPLILNSTGLVDLVVPINRQRGNQDIASLRIPIQVTTTPVAPVRVDSCISAGNAASLLALGSRDCKLRSSCGSLFNGGCREVIVREGEVKNSSTQTARGQRNTSSVCINGNMVVMNTEGSY